MNRNPLFLTEPDQRFHFNMAVEDFQNYPPKTVMDMFKAVVAKYEDEAAFKFKEAGVDTFHTMTYAHYWSKCMLFAKSLHHLGIPKFGVVNIIGFNSCEWFIAAIGSIMAGCIPTGIYTTNSPETCRYISEHSNAEVIVLHGNKQLEKYMEIIEHLPNVKSIVVWGEMTEDRFAESLSSRLPRGLHAWDAFLAIGHELPDSVVMERWNEIEAGNCATLIYTSGTTGPPKAVMISHDNITWTAKNVVTSGYIFLDHNDRLVSYLPLSHVAAQMIDIYCMMAIGGTVYFAQPDALRGSLVDTLREVKPTFFFGVPRVYEKLMESMKHTQASAGALQKFLASQCQYIGTAKSQAAQIGGSGALPFGYNLANSMYFKKIKRALGLNKCKGCFTAAAPIAPETLWYFASLDIPVYEVFGQSECTGPHTVSAAQYWKIGTCGRPLRGTETKVEAATGELCYRGRHIFMGYMHMPSETAACFDDDEFFHSGDVAMMEQGTDMITITGRIKELIITAGGENISPGQIENAVKQAMPAVSNCFVIGDKRKHLSMLVSLKCDVNSASDDLVAEALEASEQMGSKAMTYMAAKEDPKWAEYIEEGMKRVNAKAQSNAQKIQKWRWLPNDFTEQGGELTATLKVKRNKVTQSYDELIESMYRDENEQQQHHHHPEKMQQEQKEQMKEEAKCAAEMTAQPIQI